MNPSATVQVHALRCLVVIIWAVIRTAGVAAVNADTTDGRGNPEGQWVILAHGFFSTSLDMRYLENYLRRQGYHTLAPGLPTTLGSLQACTAAFEKAYATLPPGYSRLHLVGHSMGGLIIREFLARNRVPNLGRCVLIATPNRGTPLAARAIARFGLLVQWMKSLEVLRSGGLAIPPPQNRPPPEIGVIAGWSRSLSWGTLFMEGENDGRVPLRSVPLAGMADFKILPLSHNRIHHKPETAELIARFLQTGSFR